MRTILNAIVFLTVIGGWQLAHADDFVNWKPLIKETVATSPDLESITPLINFIDTNASGYADRVKLSFNVWDAGTNSKLFKTNVMAVDLPNHACTSPAWVDVDFEVKFTNETGLRSNMGLIVNVACEESGTFEEKETYKTIVYSADVSQSPAGGGTAWLKAWDRDAMAFNNLDWDNDTFKEIIVTLVFDEVDTIDARVMILNQVTGAVEAANRYTIVDK